MSARLFHQNIQGLTRSKIEYVHSLLNREADPFQIALISETWWPSENLWLHHPYTVLTSSPPSSAEVESRTGHLPGGLAVFAPPHEKRHISAITSSKYHIYFRYRGVKILFVYLPPKSLSNAQIEALLQSILPSLPDILVGDLI